MSIFKGEEEYKRTKKCFSNAACCRELSEIARSESNNMMNETHKNATSLYFFSKK